MNWRIVCRQNLDKPVAGQPCIVVMSDGRIRKVIRR